MQNDRSLVERSEVMTPRGTQSAGILLDGEVAASINASQDRCPARLRRGTGSLLFKETCPRGAHGDG